jgi:hypothetical protein
LDEEPKEEEIGKAYKICANFWLQDLKKRDQLEDPVEDGRIILN